MRTQRTSLHHAIPHQSVVSIPMPRQHAAWLAERRVCNSIVHSECRIITHCTACHQSTINHSAFTLTWEKSKHRLKRSVERSIAITMKHQPRRSGSYFPLKQTAWTRRRSVKAPIGRKGTQILFPSLDTNQALSFGAYWLFLIKHRHLLHRSDSKKEGVLQETASPTQFNLQRNRVCLQQLPFPAPANRPQSPTSPFFELWQSSKEFVAAVEDSSTTSMEDSSATSEFSAEGDPTIHLCSDPIYRQIQTSMQQDVNLKVCTVSVKVEVPAIAEDRSKIQGDEFWKTPIDREKASWKTMSQIVKAVLYIPRGQEDLAFLNAQAVQNQLGPAVDFYFKQLVDPCGGMFHGDITLPIRISSKNLHLKATIWFRFDGKAKVAALLMRASGNFPDDFAMIGVKPCTIDGYEITPAFGLTERTNIHVDSKGPFITNENVGDSKFKLELFHLWPTGEVDPGANIKNAASATILTSFKRSIGLWLPTYNDKASAIQVPVALQFRKETKRLLVWGSIQATFSENTTVANVEDTTAYDRRFAPAEQVLVFDSRSWLLSQGQDEQLNRRVLPFGPTFPLLEDFPCPCCRDPQNPHHFEWTIGNTDAGPSANPPGPLVARITLMRVSSEALELAKNKSGSISELTTGNDKGRYPPNVPWAAEREVEIMEELLGCKPDSGGVQGFQRKVDEFQRKLDKIGCPHNPTATLKKKYTGLIYALNQSETACCQLKTSAKESDVPVGSVRPSLAVWNMKDGVVAIVRVVDHSSASKIPRPTGGLCATINDTDVDHKLWIKPKQSLVVSSDEEVWRAGTDKSPAKPMQSLVVSSDQELGRADTDKTPAKRKTDPLLETPQPSKKPKMKNSINSNAFPVLLENERKAENRSQYVKLTGISFEDNLEEKIKQNFKDNTHKANLAKRVIEDCEAQSYKKQQDLREEGLIQRLSARQLLDSFGKRLKDNKTAPDPSPLQLKLQTKINKRVKDSKYAKFQIHQSRTWSGRVVGRESIAVLRKRHIRIQDAVKEMQLAAKVRLARDEPEQILQTLLEYLLREGLWTNERGGLFVMSLMNLLISGQEPDTAIPGDGLYKRLLHGHRENHTTDAVKALCCVYAGLSFHAGTNSVLDVTMGLVNEDNSEDPDLPKSTALLMEIIPVFEAIANGFLPGFDTKAMKTELVSAKTGRYITKNTLEKQKRCGTIDYESWVEQFCAPENSTSRGSCKSKVSDTTVMFNIVIVMQLLGIVLSSAKKNESFKRVQNFLLSDDNQRTLWLLPYYRYKLKGKIEPISGCPVIDNVEEGGVPLIPTLTLRTAPLNEHGYPTNDQRGFPTFKGKTYNCNMWRGPYEQKVNLQPAYNLRMKGVQNEIKKGRGYEPQFYRLDNPGRPWEQRPQQVLKVVGKLEDEDFWENFEPMQVNRVEYEQYNGKPSQPQPECKEIPDDL